MRIDQYIFSGVRVLQSASSGSARVLFAVFVSILITIPLYVVLPKAWIDIPIFLWAGFIGVYWIYKTTATQKETFRNDRKVSIGAAILTWMIIGGVIYSDPRNWAGELAFKGLMIAGAVYLCCRYLFTPIFLPITAGEEDDDDDYEFDEEDDDEEQTEEESPAEESPPAQQAEAS